MIRSCIDALRGLVTAPLTLLAISPADAVAARRATPVSEIVVEVSTNRTLYASEATLRRPPASLAKVMTLLLVFDALEAGRLRNSDNIVMTASGARQAPTRLGLARGRTMSVTSAVQAVAVISANDVAVALADRLSGSEAKFVTQMNRRAAGIGMTATQFGNVTGLAPGAGFTTARDMAILARYMIQRHPSRYKVFATRFIRWKGWVRPNHNQLLGRVGGMDGMKTGYTVAAGFNLIASARRANRRVAVVVMGASTAAARDLLVTNLMEVGFASPGVPRPTPTAKSKPTDRTSKPLRSKLSRRPRGSASRDKALRDGNTVKRPARLPRALQAADRSPRRGS